jgi:hypothetical protein
MHMAIELNNRTKILAGVVVLAAVGAGAWFFFLEDFLSEPPPKPAAVKSAPAGAPKQADAAKAGEAGKAAVVASKQAEPAKAAAAAAGAKPIPTSPDRLIAEVIETAGVKARLQNYGVGAAIRQKASDADSKEISQISARTFDVEAMTAEIAAGLKSAFDADRMTRFLEILRQPAAARIAALSAGPGPEETAKLLEGLSKNPPSAARQKLIVAVDEIMQVSETGVQLATLEAREVEDASLAATQKAGKRAPKETKQKVAAQNTASQGAMRNAFRNLLHVTYRDATDQELADYIKLVDTDTGRWGMEVLANAQRAAIEARTHDFATAVAQVLVRQQVTAQAPAQKPAEAVEEQKAAEKPRAAPAEAPGYRRPANIRDAYSRYNDVISATVMRDRAAVKELLEDGKNPNARQSDGITPLMIAVSNGDADIAAMLLAKGADPNLRAGGRSALSIAKSRGSSGAALVQLLERNGAKD